MSVIKHRIRFSRKDASFLETLKVRLDWSLSNLVWLRMSLLIPGVFDLMAFKGPFQLTLFYDSIKENNPQKVTLAKS